MYILVSLVVVSTGWSIFGLADAHNVWCLGLHPARFEWWACRFLFRADPMVGNESHKENRRSPKTDSKTLVNRTSRRLLANPLRQ